MEAHLTTQQIIEEAEQQLWLGDAEPDALHEHNRKVIAAAIEKATEELRGQNANWQAAVGDLSKQLREEIESRAAHGTSAVADASEPWTVKIDKFGDGSITLGNGEFIQVTGFKVYAEEIVAAHNASEQP